MKKLLKNPVISIYIALIILVVIFSFMSPTFFTVNNILTILKQNLQQLLHLRQLQLPA